MIRLKELRTNDRNPRIIKSEQFAKLVKSVKEFPEMLKLRPLIVTDSGEVIGGNMRYKALESLGYEEIPDDWVMCASNLTEEQRKRFIISDNITMGDWDFDMLANEWELSELKALGFDLADFGMDLDMNTGLTDEDDVPETPEEPITKAGDLWILGDHRLLCGNSTKREDVERLMDGKKADMVFTDPPYGVNYDGGSKLRNKLAGDDTTDLYEPCCKMARDFSTNEAALYLWHAGVKGIAAAVAAAAADWVVRCEIVWNKNKAQFGALSAQYKQKHEPCYYCYKKGKTVNWCGPKNEVTVWDVVRASVNEYHPTQKPVELAKRAIQNHKADSVLDLFGGSGSTLIACEQLNRKCYMMELDAGYCDVIVKRWEDFAGRKATRE